MIEEIHIFGIYMPSALAWAVVALAVTFLLRGVLQRLPLRVLLWQPALLELATFFLLWWGFARLADACFPHRLLS
ncbi:DUF1656 domain-containing protein [Burkholderia diffusa]|uniref:DUF1656 domain-containing protein n=1 Tax=Burkholderia diffusa TaxID=488732 RepID=UPI00075585B7|nr:DUF1656 domain-containing protein [Burkholderia diffusa]AOI59169.1 hypothetical protein WI26_15835 [Burkholderia diffusa]KVC50117.1 hypothetical protein WI71_05185 [Burkholderia diffusa]